LPKAYAKPAPSPEWRSTMDELATLAQAKYHRLVYDTPEMQTYWQQATPINEISQLRIGSRPAKRNTTDNSVKNLRAIPWGFSWMQARHVLPGWYGLGTALGGYATDEPRLEKLREMYNGWDFFRVLMENAQISMCKADMSIARLYANLVEDEAIRTHVFGLILDEYERTRSWILEIIEKSQLLDNQPVLQRSIYFRNPYVDPLNFTQIHLLQKLRNLDEPSSKPYQDTLHAIFLTINGVAAGLKNTG